MTNWEWLEALANNSPDELQAWFDSEHVETANATSHGDTAALEAKIAELTEKLRIGWECECRLQAERDELKAEHERIVQELVDANTRQCERTNELTAERDKLKELNEYHALQYELASEDCDRLQAEVDTLKAERVKLRSQICKLEDDLVRTSDERDNWKANCEDWKKDCERYRSKFGKCLDYADAIHALMDDEGMA